MKIVCQNCRSAFKLVALKGDKARVPDDKKVVARCSVCCDVPAYTLKEPPRNDEDRARLRVATLHEHLWSRARHLCALGRKDAGDMLKCFGCKEKDKIDADFCRLGTEYNELLLTPTDVDDTTDMGDVLMPWDE